MANNHQTTIDTHTLSLWLGRVTLLQADGLLSPAGCWARPQAMVPPHVHPAGIPPGSREGSFPGSSQCSEGMPSPTRSRQASAPSVSAKAT